MTLNTLIFPYDYIILIVVLFFVLFNFWKGFIQSVLSLLTWVGSILITIYAYENLSEFITSQILNINFFQQYEYLTNLLSIVLSIPIIFLISLFILKRIRNFLNADLDKQILGIIFDKFFGFLYGIIFSYVLVTASIILLDRFELKSLNNWLNKNSIIISQINTINSDYLNLINSLENINSSIETDSIISD